MRIWLAWLVALAWGLEAAAFWLWLMFRFWAFGIEQLTHTENAFILLCAGFHTVACLAFGAVGAFFFFFLIFGLTYWFFKDKTHVKHKKTTSG